MKWINLLIVFLVCLFVGISFHIVRTKLKTSGLYEVELPQGWQRIPDTNFVTDTKGDTLEIIEEVRVTYHYRVVTKEDRDKIKLTPKKRHNHAHYPH